MEVLILVPVVVCIQAQEAEHIQDQEVDFTQALAEAPTVDLAVDYILDLVGVYILDQVEVCIQVQVAECIQDLTPILIWQSILHGRSLLLNLEKWANIEKPILLLKL
jgi:hypothetical protein